MCFASTGTTVMPPTLEEVERAPAHKGQDARWALARRVAKSSTFAKSEQLPKLLLYVCKMAISDRIDEINEQKIGVDVFGRSPNYDPAADSIVRSHATRLRQRLELYFNGEGADEVLRIEIPRGAYVPHFCSNEAKAPGVVAPPKSEDAVDVATGHLALVPVLAPSLPRDKMSRLRWLKPFLCGLAVAVAAIAVLLHLRHDTAAGGNRSKTRQTEVERRFWDMLFPSDGRTLIVPGDSGLVLYETVTEQEVTLTDYLGGDYRDRNKSKSVASTTSKALTLDLAARRYTSFVDLGLSSRLSHLPQWTPERSQTIFARDLRPADAGNSNLILIGSRQANPWISLVEPSLNFVLVEKGKAQFHFLNRHPLPGEQTEYTPKGEVGNLGASTVYGQVAYLPNPSGQGMVLVLGGLWMSGTQSAGNFVLNGHQFSDWLSSIANRDGKIPPFELLIGTKNLQGSATSSSILAKRVRDK